MMTFLPTPTPDLGIVKGPQFGLDSISIEPPGRKVSPWFPGDVKPVRPGVYERHFLVRPPPKPTDRVHEFAYWDGAKWYRSSGTVDEAGSLYYLRVGTHSQDDGQWRGLLNPFLIEGEIV